MTLAGFDSGIYFNNSFNDDSGSWLTFKTTSNNGTRTTITAKDGTVYNYANATTWNQTSDIRIKENIITIPNALETLTLLNPVIFDYTQKYAEKREWNENKRIGNYGFVAQEFETVLPKAVTKSSEEINGEKVDDFRSINDGELIPILVKAIQEQQSQINSLKQEVELLKQK